MSLPEPDQTPLPFTSYKRVRRRRRPGITHRLGSGWKRVPRRTKRLLFKVGIGIVVTVLAVLLAFLVVALQ